MDRPDSGYRRSTVFGGDPCPGCDDPFYPNEPIELWLGRLWHRGCLDEYARTHPTPVEADA
jgi:hypothetical protein